MTSPPAPIARLLRALPGHGFAPPEADVDSAAAGAANLPRAADDQAAAFAAEVRAFAADYWNFAPTTRRAWWGRLSARAFGPAAAWLAELEAGLNVVPAPQPDTLAAAMADLARELVTLPPTERAARRLAWLRAGSRLDPGWVAAARTVLRTDLPLARLEPRLFDWYSLNALPHPVEPAANVPDRFDLSDYTATYTPAPVGAPAPVPVGAPSLNQAVFGTGCSGWGVGLFVVVTVLRVLIGGCGRQSDPPPRARPEPLPYYQPAPSPPRGQALPGEAPFTAEEIKQFRQCDLELIVGKGKAISPPPPRYYRWVERGKPLWTAP